MAEEIKITKITGKGLRFSISENNEEVARGHLYILTNDLHKEPFGFMEDVFVKEEYRSKGYGTKIVKAVVDKAKEVGCYKLIGTSRFTRPEVHRFYDKLGFKKYGYEFRVDFK